MKNESNTQLKRSLGLSTVMLSVIGMVIGLSLIHICLGRQWYFGDSKGPGDICETGYRHG